MRANLPIIESCDDCGACCQVVTTPPFRRDIDGTGEEAWERLGWERPELTKEILNQDRARRTRGDPTYGTPCLWFDAETRLCRHYEHRPRACRLFEVGSRDCVDARRRAERGGPR